MKLLFYIRNLPEGLLLKNDIVARVMAENMLSCKFTDALIHVWKKRNERTTDITSTATIRPL
jgi:hypothetical protein